MATFIKIGNRAALLLVLAAAVIAWAVIAPESLQATVDAAVDAANSLEVNVGG